MKLRMYKSSIFTMMTAFSSLIVASSSWAGITVIPMGKQESPKVANLVVEPHYGECIEKVSHRKGHKHHVKHRKMKVKHRMLKAELEPTIEKLQYEPVSADLPLLTEEIRSDEYQNGAFYEGATEAVFRSDSILEVQGEAIIEQSNLAGPTT